MNNNLKFDFTTSINGVVNNQPIAILPAELAQRVLKVYAESLMTTLSRSIIDKHISNLKEADNVTEALEISLEFIQERELVQNVLQAKWDAYEVKAVQA